MSELYKSQPKDFGQAMERKEQSISRFQDTKELSIRVASSMRDAVLVSIENPKFKLMSKDEQKKYIQEWRKWFFEQYDPNEVSKNLTSPF